MQKEIEGYKADKSTIEDDILLLMEEVDKARVDIVKQKQLLIEQENQLKEQTRRIEEELKDIEKGLSEFGAQREAIVSQVDPNTLRKYEKILRSKNGLAIVPVKDDACQGCNMDLPPQVINEIRLKGEFIICENCTRFLYTDDASV